MSILIFDTETITLEKKLIYNLGYIVVNEEGEILLKRDFLNKKFWYNVPLMYTAYFFEKKSLYKPLIRNKLISIDSWDNITTAMQQDIDYFNINSCYAYNCSFDIGAFKTTSDFEKTNNPLDSLEVFDIKAQTSLIFSKNKEYLNFCLQYSFLTLTGLASLKVEHITAFLLNDPNFKEQHTALDDSLHEKNILFYTLTKGYKLNTFYDTVTMPKLKKDLILAVNAETNSKTEIEIQSSRKINYIDKKKVVYRVLF